MSISYFFDEDRWEIKSIMAEPNTLIEVTFIEKGSYRGKTNPLWQKHITTYGDIPKIMKVIYNRPATIVLWGDGTKTVVKCQAGDEFSRELGLAMCICKRAFGNKGNYNEVFKRWVYETN